MEYYCTRKMILRILFWSTFISALHSHPATQNFKLPNLDVSTPEDVNSLEREEPLSRSIDPQNSKSNSIDDTVQVVEEIIKSNPALPRLTRGEILDLLENITSTDEQKAHLLGRNRDPKAVMVVMPYTPTNNKNMEDLYTKAPVTHIIDAEPFKTKEEVNKIKHSRRRPPVQFNDTDNDLAKKPLFTEEKKKYSATISEKVTKPTSPPRNPIRRRRPQATTQLPRKPLEASSEPPLTTYQPKPTLATTYHPKPRRPLRRRTTTLPTTYHPNHRYPDDGIRIIDSPKLTQNNDASLPDLDLEENVKQEVVIKPNRPLSEDIMVPDNLKTVMKDMNVETAMKPEDEEVKKTLEEQKRIKNLLASIGVLPEKTTTTTTTEVPNAESVADSLSPEMRDLLMSFGLLPNSGEKPVVEEKQQYNPEKAEIKPESYIGFKPLPDDGPSRDDMDALLASFGLGRSARKEKSLKVTDKDKPKEEYNLDMIPEHLKGVITDLGITGDRDGRKIRTSSEKQQVTTQHEPPKHETTEEELKRVDKQHVFNPDTQYASEEELKKLEQLIGMIKELEKLNGTATEEDLKKFDLEGLKELINSLNGNNETLTLDQKESGSPDPNNFDSGLIKNEVKRQENSTTTSTTEASKVESETPSLTDLEASFGGQTEAVTEPPVPETTTRKTGFYYLLDWNTFLDIDDTKGKRVNLRFQPTIGDPKRFLSVSVP